MRGKRTIGMAALLAVAGAGAAVSSAAISSADTPKSFVVDAESQYLLDVNIRRLRLGEGVRGYPTPEGSCLMLGDMVTVLDVPLKVDLAARKASGWVFRENYRRRRAHRALRRQAGSARPFRRARNPRRLVRPQ